MKLAFSLALCLAFTVPAAFADHKLGQPFTAKEAMPLATLMAQPSTYVGKTVQVKGKVTEVCVNAGCWMYLTDNDGHFLRIKVEDGVIVFPQDSIGKYAIAEGKLEKHEMTREQLISEAQHEAQESGRKFNAAKIKSGKTIYEIAGSGALILE